MNLLVAAIMLVTAGVWSSSAFALQPIVVQSDLDNIEITTLGDAYQSQGDSLQIETAPGADGVTGRMSVRASTPGMSPNWMVFALTNPTDKPIERWLTADRYNVIGSGTIWPDLDARRIEAVTPSVGFVPERIKSDTADIFRVTLEPGQTITYVTELSSERFARLYLWRPVDYEVANRDSQLFNGAMLGLSGLLTVFLTAIFVANHKAIFPAAAFLSWSVMTYLCVDFGLFHKVFNLRPEDNAVYRAAAEAWMAASFVIFLTTFLRLSMWHGLVRMLLGVWWIAQLTLIAVAVIDPRLAATFARLSFVGIGAIGAVLTLFLVFRGQDRALSLIPTWVLFLVWVFAAGLTLSGRLGGEAIVTSLILGLVLVLILIGYTVTQFAFRTVDPVFAGAPNDLQVRSLALAGSGATMWEWNIRRDEIKTGPEMEIALGLLPGELTGKVDDFLRHVHPTDKERFRLMLLSAQERAGVRIRSEFRLQHNDNSWRWFELEAASIPNADGRSLRCVGLVRDVSDTKRAHERLLHDAVHCSLTGLPNRALFLDRLKCTVARVRTEGGNRPAVLFIDLDKFKSANSSFGMVRGDSLLLTVARRLQRQLGPHDTVARVGGDQFAMMFTGESELKNLSALAERIRRSLRAPIPLANQDVVLTASIGVALFDGQQTEDEDLLKEAELAMYRAKRGGADRIEVFEPSMRSERDHRLEIESDLRRAIDKGQLKVLYQPIVYLPTKELAGFEALVRWEHPKLGLLNPISFVPIAEESDLISRVGSYVLLRAAKDAARWQTELPRVDRPLFVTVNVSARQLFRHESVQQIRQILGRNIVPAGTIHLEVTETLVMENPEQAAEALRSLRSAGAELSLDDFGTGYSSLAYLQRFPFDTIKIDRELVRGSSSAQGVAILRSIVALAHELSKTVVAEGIETTDEASSLRAMGCEYAQGYHFGEPIADRDVIQLLKMVRRSESKMQPRGFFRPKLNAKKADGAEKTGRGKSVRKIARSSSGENGQDSPAGSQTVVRGRRGNNDMTQPAAASAAPIGLAPPTENPFSGPLSTPTSDLLPAATPPSSHEQSISIPPGADRQPIAMPQDRSIGNPGASSGAPQAVQTGLPNTGRPKTGPASGSPIPTPSVSSQPNSLVPPPPGLLGSRPQSAMMGSESPPPPSGRPPTQPTSPPSAASPLAEALSRALPAAHWPQKSGPDVGRVMQPTPTAPSSAPPPLPGNGARPPVAGAGSGQGVPDLRTLPPGIASSLARLAGTETSANEPRAKAGDAASKAATKAKKTAES